MRDSPTVLAPVCAAAAVTLKDVVPAHVVQELAPRLERAEQAQGNRGRQERATVGSVQGSKIQRDKVVMRI